MVSWKLMPVPPAQKSILNNLVIIARRVHSVRVCVTILKKAVHHTGCFSLAFSMFYDLIAYVVSFDAVFQT